MDKITLIGAGLAGSLLAIYLARQGYAVEIYERRPDMRTTAVPAGRSINLALSARGIHALAEAGVFEGLRGSLIPMKGRMVHDSNGTCNLQRYGRDDSEVIYSISRAGLNQLLLDAAEATGRVRIHFNERCKGMHFESGTLFLQNETTGRKHSLVTQPVIGTDGSASAIRVAMLGTTRFNFSQYYLEYGYKELAIPPGPGGRYLLGEKNALHIWPRETFMLIALPNTDGSFTCTFFYPFEGQHSLASLDTPALVHQFFQQQFPDAVPLMPDLIADFFGHPTGSLITIQCFPWHVGAQALILGDAAHAIVPFFGQGMNCAFEDCSSLNACLAEIGPDWAQVFAAFEKARKTHTDAIATMSFQNFIEMRDSVADPRFVLKKQVEKLLEQRFPGQFIPQYSMVSFHRIPYADALKRGQVQDRILQQLCRGIQRPEELDWELAQALVSKKLQPAPAPGA